MSIFGSIVSKIFHHGGNATASNAAPAAQTDSAATSVPAPNAAPTPQDQGAAATPAVEASAAPATPAPTAPSSAGETVDVAAVLEGLAAKNPQKLDWRHSIVDMMKLLELDSSLTARKELAKELAYSGDTNDSASMNVWLHAQVMKKLAENGGKVPDDLRG